MKQQRVQITVYSDGKRSGSSKILLDDCIKNFEGRIKPERLEYMTTILREGGGYEFSMYGNIVNIVPIK